MISPAFTVADVDRAAVRLAGHVRRTPVIATEPGLFGSGAAVWLKLEQLQHSGSFKVRGALNRILTAVEQGTLPAAGVVAASGGNAGLGVAHAAKSVGTPATVFVPRSAPPVKVARLRALGAGVVLAGAEYAEANEAALTRAAETGALFCHAYDQPEVVAGQGTVGLELADQISTGFDTVLVAVGGGGLIAGIATALEGRAGRVGVVGVEPESAPTLHRALAAGGPVDVAVSGVAADALGARRLGRIAYEVLTRTDARSLLVSDADIVAARQVLWERLRLVVEHGTAAAVAALLTGAYLPSPGERVAVVLCGANTDPAGLAEQPLNGAV